MNRTVLVIWYDGNNSRATLCRTGVPDSTVPAMFKSLDGNFLEALSHDNDGGGEVAITAVVAFDEAQANTERLDEVLTVYIDEQPHTIA